MIHGGIPSQEIKKSPIIPLNIVMHYRRKTLTVSSGNPFKTDTRKMHKLKTHPKLQSKYKESTPSSLDVASSWVSNEVDYTTGINHKPTKEELDNMGNTEKDVFGKIGINSIHMLK